MDTDNAIYIRVNFYAQNKQNTTDLFVLSDDKDDLQCTINIHC